MSQNPFHITARCPNREPFHCDLEEVWSIMEDFLFLMHHQHGLKIHSFVLMPNHFHLLASSPETPINHAMRDLMWHTSKAMNDQSFRINQAWGARHFRCELRAYNYFVNTYKYIYQNPVRAHLVTACEDWHYSTLFGLLGFKKLIIPIENDLILFPDYIDLSALEWINKPISESHRLQMKKSLARNHFHLPLDRSSKKPSVLEDQRI